MDENTDIRENLHKIINSIENNDLLEMVYEVLESKNQYKQGSLINNLNVAERKELYESYNESLDESKLVDLEALKKSHSKWLEK